MRAGVTDLARPGDLCCRALVQAALDRFGGVDVLVQNGHDQGDWSSVADADPCCWRQTIETNLFGALHLFQACLPSMKAKGDGRIVFVNSGAANTRPQPGLAAYSAGKAWAMASLVRSIALEHGRDGIRCNGVHMGVIAGKHVQPWFEMVAAQQAASRSRSIWTPITAAYLPLRYVPTPKECAGSVIFLASDMARVMTGQAISVNGGEWFGSWVFLILPRRGRGTAKAVEGSRLTKTQRRAG